MPMNVQQERLRGQANAVHNRGPGRSINLSAFSSDNPGTQVSSTTLFAFNDQIVQSAVQVSCQNSGSVA